MEPDLKQVMQLFEKSCQRYEYNSIFYQENLFVKLAKYTRELGQDKISREKLQKSDPECKLQPFGSESWKQNFPNLNPNNFLHWVVLIDSMYSDDKKPEMFESIVMGFRQIVGHVRCIMALVELQRFAHKNKWNIFEVLRVEVVLADLCCHGNRGVEKLDKSKDFETFYSFIRQTMNCLAFPISKVIDKRNNDNL